MSRIVLCATGALLLGAFALTQGSVARTATGNRAHGFDYQPTPGEVDAREKAAGVRPPSARQKAADKSLEQIDRDLLRKEGAGTQSVPDIRPH